MEQSLQNINLATLGIGGGLGLIGIGFIIKQLRFWFNGTPTKNVIATDEFKNVMQTRLDKIEKDISEIFAVIRTQGELIAELKGYLEAFCKGQKTRG